MANQTVLQKPTAGTLTGAEFLYLIQSSLDKKATINQIVEFIGTGVYSASVDTSGATITLDMASFKDAILTGSASIGSGKTIAFDNVGNGKRLNFLFNLTDNYPLVFPSTVKMQNWVGEWDSGTYTWTPTGGAGAYRAELYYNGTNWLLTIYGPH